MNHHEGDVHQQEGAPGKARAGHWGVCCERGFVAGVVRRVCFLERIPLLGDAREDQKLGQAVPRHLIGFAG